MEASVPYLSYVTRAVPLYPGQLSFIKWPLTQLNSSLAQQPVGHGVCSLLSLSLSPLPVSGESGLPAGISQSPEAPAMSASLL